MGKMFPSEGPEDISPQNQISKDHGGLLTFLGSTFPLVGLAEEHVPNQSLSSQGLRHEQSPGLCRWDV